MNKFDHKIKGKNKEDHHRENKTTEKYWKLWLQKTSNDKIKTEAESCFVTKISFEKSIWDNVTFTQTEHNKDLRDYF